MTFVDAGMLESIPRRGARVLRIADRAIALFRTTDDRVYALEDRCPHRGGPLSQGIVHGHCVTCPLHDWIIDLESGEATGPDEGATARYDVRIDDGRILVRSEPLTEGTLPRDEPDARDEADADAGDAHAARDERGAREARDDEERPLAAAKATAGA